MGIGIMLNSTSENKPCNKINLGFSKDKKAGEKVRNTLDLALCQLVDGGNVEMNSTFKRTLAHLEEPYNFECLALQNWGMRLSVFSHVVIELRLPLILGNRDERRVSIFN